MTPDVCITFWLLYLCPLEGHKYGIPILSPINFSYIFWRIKLISRKAHRPETWAGCLFISILHLSKTLGFRNSMVLVLVFNGMTVKTIKYFYSYWNLPATAAIISLPLNNQLLVLPQGGRTYQHAYFPHYCPHVSYDTTWENLFKHQDISSLVIISFIHFSYLKLLISQ